MKNTAKTQKPKQPKANNKPKAPKPTNSENGPSKKPVKRKLEDKPEANVKKPQVNNQKKPKLDVQKPSKPAQPKKNKQNEPEKEKLQKFAGTNTVAAKPKPVKTLDPKAEEKRLAKIKSRQEKMKEKRLKTRSLLKKAAEGAVSGQITVPELEKYLSQLKGLKEKKSESSTTKGRIWRLQKLIETATKTVPAKVEEAKKKVGITEVFLSKESGKVVEKKGAKKEEAKKGLKKENAKKEVAKKENSAQKAKKENSGQNVKKESKVQNIKKENSVQNAKKENSVQKENSAQNAKKNQKAVKKIKIEVKEETADSDDSDYDVEGSVDVLKKLVPQEDSDDDDDASEDEDASGTEEASEDEEASDADNDDDDNEDDENEEGEDDDEEKDVKNKTKQSKPNQTGQKVRYIVFVGNLPYDVDQKGISEHFQKVGKILDIRIISDHKTNKPRGFCYVEVENEEAYQKALSLHHSILNGRRINVLYTMGGKKKGPEQKKQIREKNFKLQEMRKQGKLAGSVNEAQKRAARRKKRLHLQNKE